MLRYDLLCLISVSSFYICPSDDFNLEKFLNSSPEILRNRKQDLVRLERQGKLKITPTESQLFHGNPVENQKKLYKQLRTIVGRDTLVKSLTDKPLEWIQNKAQTILKPQQLKALNDAMAKEKQVYDEGGLAVYHSTQPKYYAESYIRTRVADLVSELQGTPLPPSKMLLLRDVGCRKDPEGEKKLRKWALQHDFYDKSYRDYSLACNIGLAGNTITLEPDEGLLSSTLQYWLGKTNISMGKYPFITPEPPYKVMLENVKKDLDSAVNRYQESNTTGTLLQLIFKDKGLANKVMYVSLLGGEKNPLKNTKGETIAKNPQEVAHLLSTNPTSLADIKREIFLKAETHKLENLQTRALLTTDKLLDSTNQKVRKSFEVVPYTDNPQSLDEFHKRVDVIIDRARRNYRAEYRAMTLPQKFWHKMNMIFNKQEGYWQKKQRIKEESQHWFIAQ